MKKTISIIILLLVASISGYYFYQNFSFTVPESSPVTQVNPADQSKSNKFKIVAAGDSLTAGYGLNISESYPAQLEQLLLARGKNIEVVNMGVSGETTAGLLERIDFIKKQNPDLIIITIGGNDALRALPPEETKANIQKIIQSLKQDVAKDNIFLANIQAPGNLGLLYTSKFNRTFSDIAAQEDINLLQFVVPEVFTNQSLMQGDGIHPNKAGYTQIVERHILESILQQIDN